MLLRLTGGVVDTYESYVWEPSLVKINALTAATEAACLVLSIDETVTNPKSEAANMAPGARFAVKARRVARSRSQQPRLTVSMSQGLTRPHRHVQASMADCLRQCSGSIREFGFAVAGSMPGPPGGGMGRGRGRGGRGRGRGMRR